MLKNTSISAIGNNQNQYMEDVHTIQITNTDNRDKSQHFRLNVIHTDNKIEQQQNYIINEEGDDPMISAQLMGLQENQTGYEVMRQAYNDEEIKQAFKIIDVNRDQYITKDDIIFFLEYLQENYCEEEVDEMIAMVTKSDKVSLEDFLKIGKGVLIPLADTKVPDNKVHKKQCILKNVKSTGLSILDPRKVIQAQEKQIVSFNQYIQSQNKQQQIPQDTKQSDEDLQYNKLKAQTKLRTKLQMHSRSEQFHNILSINVDEAITKYKNGLDKYLNFYQIAALLEITNQQAHLLYSNEQIHSKQIIIEAIAYSNLNKLRKVQLCMNIINNCSNIKFRQVLLVLEALYGIDENDSMKKKLTIILKNSKYSQQNYINKYQMLQLISEYSHIII